MKSSSMKIIMVTGALLAVGTLCANGGTALWPSESGILRAQPSSKVTVTNGLALVETGTDYTWPGVRLDFREKLRDFSDLGRLTVFVTNPSPKAVKVCLSVKSQALQGQSPGGSVDLAPQAAGRITARLDTYPWRLDRPLELVGMRGAPAEAGSRMFDVRRVESLHIFRGGASAPATFAVTGIEAEERESVSEAKVLSAATFKPFVDVYGQFRHDDWPGKIHSDDELRKSAADEAKWLEEHGESPIAGCDAYGGWAAGPQLKATGYFRTEKVEGKWWFVDPDGHLFFSQGIDCVNHGEGVTGVQYREDYFEALPPKDDPTFGRFWGKNKWKAAHGFYAESNHYPYVTYNIGAANVRRKYGDGWEKVAADMAHRRIRAWGLNTIGNWSQVDVCRMDRTPYVLCLGTGGTPRLAWANGWWGKFPDPWNPAFEQTLRQRCRDAARWMKTDRWCLGAFVDNELSWSEDPRMKDVAEKYFSTVRKVLREELPNHLYLGCRIAWGTDVVYRAAAKYCDVVSVNIYSRHPDRDLPKDAEDKPMINGEFHFGALDRGMFHTGLVPTETQAERAQCYRDFVNACLDHPRMIGTHWFQWKDQPLTGRSDGENYQIGFLTITDTPYPEIVAASREVAATMYERRYGKSSDSKQEEDWKD